jgi:hypothetical protein
MCHLDNKSIEIYIDMDVKALNKIKGDEVIKKLHSLLTKSTEKTCIKMTIKYQQCILNCD